MPLDPNVAGLLQLVNAMPGIWEGTPEQAREAIRSLMINFRDPSQEPQVGSVDEVTVGGVPGRVYRPEASGGVPTLVYLHGGGWVIGDLDTHDWIARALCRDVGVVVVSVDYRLAPEHRFPAAVDDAYAALTDVARRIDEFGNDPAALAVGGDSAGGNLAAACAQLAHADGLDLAAQLLVYPAVDLLGDYASRTENAEGYLLTQSDMLWFAGHYLGVDESDPAVADLAKDPRLSPLHAASLAGLAPAVVATAEFDPLRDEGDAYAEALRAAGVRVEHRRFDGLIHGFYGMEAVSPAIAEASRWISGALRDILAARE